MLFREEPDHEEMMTMATGILYGQPKDGTAMVQSVSLDGHSMDSLLFAKSLCIAYAGVRQNNHELRGLDTFFGLRDFIYFMKALRARSTLRGLKMELAISDLMCSLERNFSGINIEQWKLVALEFLRHLVNQNESTILDFLNMQVRCPLRALQDLSKETSLTLGSRARFKLIIDCTEDDSIMRILSGAGLLNLSKKTLFKLSHLPEEQEGEKLRLISGVKFAAMQGHTAVLSQTETVDESFYDLQNQNFREIEGIDGSLSLYANIAIGGMSRRCPIHELFDCIVHVRASKLAETPAPFLNRFEKYRLDIGDVLSSAWSSASRLTKVLQKSRLRAGELIGLLSEKELVGWVEGQTLDSVFVGLLPAWAFRSSVDKECPHSIFSISRDSSFLSSLVTFISYITTMEKPMDRVVKVVMEALDVFSSDELSALELMVDSNDDIDIVHACLSSLLLEYDTDAGEIHPVQQSVCEKLVQMVITEHVVSTLLQIAKPESLFSRRHYLPKFMVDEYFIQQEHFALRKYVDGALRSDESQLLVVHTRTDAHVRGIPSWNSNFGFGTGRQVDQCAVRSLVCSDDKSVLIEHMDSLRSESTFRKALADWIHGSQRIFILLIDMSKEKATEHANYARMNIEQNALDDKILLLLLHYPSSSSISSFSYPALFLGKWRHTFLDGVGQSGPSLAISDSIRLACEGIDSKDGPNEQICNALEHIMPAALSRLACRKLFYKGQQLSRSSNEDGSFLERLQYLSDALSIDSGFGTAGDILRQKFASFWLDQCLITAVRAACMRLQRGTTQLSISASLHSTLLEAFDKFMAWSMMLINNWRGFDLLIDFHRSEATVALFASILMELSPPPFEELMLIQERSVLVKPMPSALDPFVGRFALFPFFYSVSTCVEEALDFAVAETPGHCMGTDGRLSQNTLNSATFEILKNMKDRRTRYSLVSAVALAIEAVENSNDLFGRYLRQFIAWKTGAATNPYINKWILDSTPERSIIAIHSLFRSRQVEFMKMASWSSLAQNKSHVFLDDAGHLRDLSSWPLVLLMDSLQNLERSIVEGSPNRNAWLARYSALLNHISIIDDLSRLVVCRVRVLCFFHALFQLSPPSAEIEAAAIDKLLLGQKVPSATASLSVLFGIVEGNPHLEEALLWNFFSSLAGFWGDHRVQDFTFLLEALDEGKLEHHSCQRNVALLLRACNCFGYREENQLNPQLLLVLPSLPACLLNTKLAHTCRVQPAFSESGERKSFPHYIPEWLRGDEGGHDGSSNEENRNELAFFASFSHAYAGTLAAVTFDMLLGRVMHESLQSSSAELFQLMLASANGEHLNESDYIRLARTRTNHNGFLSLEGSHLGAMVADARTICFVAALARDIALGTHEGSALNEPYDGVSKPVLYQIMGLTKAKFVDFFFSEILRHKGEGRLMQVLGSGGPLHDLTWCQPMREGMPIIVADNQTALLQAEAALHEATQDEERMARELKLCPHRDCSHAFSVLERNCGQFICGRDYHHVVGREGRYGCGRPFQVDQAPSYRVDEQRLAPLRHAVNTHRAHLAASQQEETKWRRARDFITPPSLFFVDSAPLGALISPSASLLHSFAEEDTNSKLVRVILKGTKLLDSLALLPDLIEVRFVAAVLELAIPRKQHTDFNLVCPPSCIYGFTLSLVRSYRKKRPWNGP